MATVGTDADASGGPSADPSAGAIVAWTYVGAVVGLALAWLPFVVSYTTSFAYYARLAWFTAWR